MSVLDYADRLRKQLSEEHDRLSIDVVEGGFRNDLQGYNHAVGYMEGLRKATDLARELLHKSAEYTIEELGDEVT